MLDSWRVACGVARRVQRMFAAGASESIDVLLHIRLRKASYSLRCDWLSGLQHSCISMSKFADHLGRLRR